MIRLLLESRGPDFAPGGTMVAGLFTGERPPKGEAGWIDWRLGGAVSRAILAGRLDGAPGTCVLTPARKLPCSRVLLLGLGSPNDFKGRALGAALDLARAKLAGMNEVDFAVALPGDKPWPMPRDTAEVLGNHLLLPYAAGAKNVRITLMGREELLSEMREWIRTQGDPIASHVVLGEPGAPQGEAQP